MQRWGIAANDPLARQAGEDLLLEGGTAVGAVLCAFFAAAGAHAGVLLCPVSIVVGGVGLGVRAFDGRCRQPGTGTKRPRGFKKNEAVPDAARVAVPGAVAAAMVAHAYDEGDRIAKILKPGISQARRAGADGRGGLLQRIRVVGAGATGESSFVRPLLREAGPSEGGLLTPPDFNQSLEVDHDAERVTVGAHPVARPPWGAEAVPTVEGAGVGCAVCAVDRRGVFAALSYRRVLDGFPIEELELEAPLNAVPVERGKTRVSPGESLAAPTPVALILDGDRPVAAVASPRAGALGADELDAPAFAVRRDEKSGAVTVDAP